MDVVQTNASDDLAPDAPVVSEALSEAQADDRLTALLGGNPETDPAKEEEGKSDAGNPEDNPPEDDEIDPSLIPEDDETVVDDENPDEPQTYAKGKFASDDAQVTLEDGTVISVAELKRNNLFQRDYSKKTEEVAREREAVTKAREEFSQLQAQVQQERDYALWYLEQNAPQEPKAPTVPSSVDPFAWVQYQEQVQKYNQVVTAWQAMHQGREADKQRAEQEQKARHDAYLAEQRTNLFEKIPVLKDEKKRQEWFESAYRDTEKYYGIKPEELNNVTDHRFYVALKDALSLRRAKEKAPAVQKEVQAKPMMAQGSGRRPNPEAQAQREINGLGKQFRQSRSAADADAYLTTLLSKQS